MKERIHEAQKIRIQLLIRITVVQLILRGSERREGAGPEEL